MPALVWVDRLSPWAFRVDLWGHTLGIRWYGLAYIVGLGVGVLWFRRAARRGSVPGLTLAAVDDLMIGLVVGVLAGARLAFVIQHPRELIADPLYAIRVWEGGMTFFGGLAGVILALVWVARRHHVAFLALGDVAAFPGALGLAVGRLANFVNGELVGRPTQAGWGVVFPTVDSQPRHPSQLYEAASHLLLLAVLIVLARLAPGWVRARRGRLASVFLVGYGLLRFVTDFYRADDTYWGPFSTGQWASLAVFVLGVVLLSVLLRPPQTSPAPPPADA